MAKKPAPSSTPASASPFALWGQKEAAAAVTKARPADYEANHAYVVKADNWQDRKGWGGPPVPAGLDDEKERWDKIKSQFTPRKQLRSCVRRAGNALLKREPSVSFTVRRTDTDTVPLTLAETALIAEANGALATWWDRRKVQKNAKLAARTSRWAGVGFLRWWIPSFLGESQADGTVKVNPTDPVDALLRFIYVASPLPEAAAIAVDEATQATAMVFTEGENAAEVYYVDGEDTIVRRVTKTAAVDTRKRMRGLLPMIAIEGEKILDEPSRAQQRRLDFFETLLIRVGEVAGFPERYTKNAEPSGTWKRVADGFVPPTGAQIREAEDGSGALEYLVPTPRMMGSGTTTDLIGIVVGKDERTGKMTRATPDVFIKEPTDPEYCIKAIKHASATILEDCHQGHVVTNSDPLPSGKSRKEARADWEADVEEAREPVEGGLRDFIESAFAGAEDLAGQPGYFTDTLRVSVDLHVDLGPADPQDIQSDVVQVEKGMMARETAMSRSGIEDPEAELKRIEAAPDAKVGLLGKLGENLSALRTAFPTGDPVVLAVAAGYTQEDAETWFGPIRDAEKLEDEETRELNASGGADDEDEDEEEEEEEGAVPEPPARKRRRSGG
jgi:hypothetical protein